MESLGRFYLLLDFLGAKFLLTGGGLSKLEFILLNAKSPNDLENPVANKNGDERNRTQGLADIWSPF